VLTNDIAYHPFIEQIQNALKPTNFAIAVQEFGNQIRVFVPVCLQVVLFWRSQSSDRCFLMNFPTSFIFRVPDNNYSSSNLRSPMNPKFSVSLGLWSRREAWSDALLLSLLRNTKKSCSNAVTVE
jgi:hypothetical protein